MKIVRVIIILITVILVSCEKDEPVKTKPSINDWIVGHWISHSDDIIFNSDNTFEYGFSYGNYTIYQGDTEYILIDLFDLNGKKLSSLNIVILDGGNSFYLHYVLTGGKYQDIKNKIFNRS